MSLNVLNVVRFPIGGIRSYLRYTYSRLDHTAYRSTVVTSNDGEAELLPAGMAPLNVHLKTVPAHKATQRALLALALATHALLRTRDFQLVHSQGTTAAVATALSARRFRVPHVITLHETFRAEQFEGALGGLKRWLLARLLGLADGIVAVGDDARDNLLEHLPLSARAVSRVEVIRNGVAVDTLLREANDTRPEHRKTLGIDDDVVLLGFIGRFMPEKGFDVLLDAVRQLTTDGRARPRFAIVAVNDGAYIREYKQQISFWGLDAYFNFAGFLPSAAGTLQELDAVIMPSRREACPLVAMEAMVLGCPLIASDCIGLREVALGTPAFSSVAGDPSSLAAAIDGFIADRLGSRSRAREYAPMARSRFGSERTAGSLAALFTRVLAVHNGG